MLAILTAGSVLFGVTLLHVQRAQISRRAQDARVQLLWLARSAASQSFEGTRQLPVLGGARLERRRSGATVTTTAASSAGTATVIVERGADGRPISWTERYAPR